MHHYLQYYRPLLVFLVGWGLHHAALAQQQPVASIQPVVKVQQREMLPLVQVLAQIKQHYQVTFGYQEALVKDKQVPTSSWNKKSLEEALQQILSPHGLDYKRLDAVHYVITRLRPQPTPLPRQPLNTRTDGLPPGTTLSASIAPVNKSTPPRLEKTITGQVTDLSTGETLPGVNIVVKNTTVGTVTDVDGHYRLTAPDDAETLVFSSVGYTSEEIAIGNQTTINLEMAPDIQSLSEIVVVGYGAVKKSNLTGAVSSIEPNDIQETPITSIDQGLVGRASGVMVTQTSGMPGAVASIRIRGTSSLQGGNEPLYVIDGFPVYNGGGYGNTGGGARISGLSTINPADIASIEILKDASATAIYGARAANGVVLITTKSGKEGRDQITFDAYYGTQSVVRQIDVMNALQYAELVNEAYTNDGLDPIYDDATLADLRANPEGTDWQDEIFRTAPIQNYQLSFSGGDKKTNYAISANYFNQQGIIRNSGFSRYSGRINVTRNVLDNLKIGTNLNISRTSSDAVRTDAGGTNGVVTSALKFNPISPVYQNEALGEYTPVNRPGIILANPVATVNEQVRQSTLLRLLGNLYAEWEFLPDLTAKVSFGTDLANTKFDTFIPSTIFESGGVAEATIRGGYTTNWLNENTLSWNKQLTTGQSISVLGGITFQQNVFEDVSASSQDFVNNVLEENALGSAAIYNEPSSTLEDWSLVSYLGRVNYNINEKYLLSVNARVDGSSRFGANNKYAFFPSGAVAWRLIEEDFIKNMKVFSNLKARVSYGVTGNQEIGLYSALPTLGSTNYTLGRSLVTGFFPNKIPNPNLRWEKTAQFDAGLDFGFWNERLRITTDYYHKKTTDLIYNVAVPFVSGFGNALQNIGSVLNQGVELSIGSDIIATQNFRWTSNFNISFNRNKVINLGGNEFQDVGDGDDHLKTGPVHRLIVGEPIGLFYGYVSDGIFQNQEAVDAGPQGPTNRVGGRRYRDLSGPEGVPDGIVNANNDRTVIGDPNPDFFGGFNNTLFYQGFELNVFVQYSYGNDIFNYNAIELELPSGGQNVYADLVNRWTPENPSQVYPAATTNRSAVFSDAYIEDGSYLKLKTLTFAYTFPGLNVSGIGGLKVYLTAQNLLTFTDYSGYDPEVSYRGASNLEMGEDFGGYPQARTVMVGVQLDIQ